VSLPGLTRQSIAFARSFAKMMMDPRVKPAGDSTALREGRTSDSAPLTYMRQPRAWARKSDLSDLRYWRTSPFTPHPCLSWDICTALRSANRHGLGAFKSIAALLNLWHIFQRLALVPSFVATRM
jgi:hypothetical protein